MKQMEWDQEQLQNVATLAEMMQAEAQVGLTVKDNLKASLLRRIADIDADQVVNDLEAGIQTFHQTLDQAKRDGLAAVADQKIEELLAGRTEEEQAALLSSLLTAFAQAAGHPASAADAEPERLDELKKAAITYISEYGVLCIHSEASELLLRELGQDGLEALENAQIQSCDESYMALAMYLLKVRGELDAVPDEMSAREIGAAAAAASAVNETVADGLTGKKTWEKVLAALKMIAGAALLAILVVAAVKFALFAGALTFYLARLAIGLGAIGLIGGVIFGFTAVRGVAETAVSLGRTVLQVSHLDTVLEAGRSKLYDLLAQNVFHRVRAFWDKLKEQCGALEEAAACQQPEDPEVQEEAAAVHAL